MSSSLGGYLRQRRAVFVLLTASVILAGLLLFYILSSSAAPNTDSLVGYWKFEEVNAPDSKVDASGDGRTGAPSGTVLPQPSSNTPPTNFENNRSLTFNNTNNAVNVASTTSLDDLPALTASAWIHPTSYAGESAQGRIIDKTNSTNGWSFFVDNGALSFYANFSNSALSKVTTATLPTDEWAHVAVAWDGSASMTGVKLYINGVEQTSATGNDGTGSRVADTTYSIVIGNNAALNRTFSGYIDELRLYNRMLADTEVDEIADGGHPSTVWTGSVSSDYETAGNWSTGAIPDPYSYVVINPVEHQPVASAAVSLAGLTIEAGARFNLLGYDLTVNDSGTFDNQGTLQLRNTQTVTGFMNDTDSGTVLVTPQSDTTGLKLGDSYHNLIVNDSTFAHWPLDETSGAVAQDVSGFDLHASYEGDPAPAADVPSTKFANSSSLSFDGEDDYVSFEEQTIPANATWCAWVNITSGDGVVLGAAQPGQYALAIFGGTEVRAYQYVGSQTASWSVASLYNSWNHICITQSTVVTSSLTLYINGVSQGGSESLDGGAGVVSTIGSDTDTYFTGMIDDVRIYNRVLTGMEIGRMTAGNQPATILYRTTLSGATSVSGDLVINSGIFDVSTNHYQLSIGGNFDNHGGVFQQRNGTVVLDGGDQRVASTTTFYNLQKTVTEAATLSFGRGSTTTVGNQLTLQGAENQLLSLRSTTDGEEWFIDPQGAKTVSYLDVKDSHNINAYPVDITNTNTVDSGNNTNWTINVAPDSPTNLGGASYVDGSFVGDSTPSLSFTLTDDNDMDQLRYHLQIDDDSDFSSPEVDYTSGLGSQGLRGFTVGQSEEDDTYTVGEAGMTLPTADYYWRVRAIDGYSSPHTSGYTTANEGEVAFRLDVTPPLDPGIPATASSQTEKRPTWEWQASEDAGVGLGTPTYTIQWSTDSEFGSYSSNTTSNTSFTHGSNLSDGQWYFRVRAEDGLGNQSAWVVSEEHLIDTTGPLTPVAPYTPSPTNFNELTWSWAATTDAGIGLATEDPYTVQWSKVSNFSSGVFSDTSDSNSYQHASPIADGTWYFRVRAEDGLGNQSAWSANGVVIVDTLPPSLPGTPYTDDPTNNNKPKWEWDASLDDGVGLTGVPYTVQWSTMQNFSVLGGSTTSATNEFTHGGPLADGTWYIRVNAKDNLSNQSAYSGVGEVTIDTVAPNVPNAPTTTTPTNDDTPTWSWNIPDDVGVGLADIPYDVEWSTDEEFNTIEGSQTVDTNSFTHTASLAEGDWYFRVRATDKADNTSEWSVEGEVYIDVTPPTTPGLPDTEDPVNDNTPEWEWAPSTDSGIGLRDPDAYEVEWSTEETFEDEGLILSDTAEDATFTHSDALADGTWYFRVRAVDKVGNASAWSAVANKVVDILPPTAPGLPTTTDPTADNTPQWEWEGSEDAGVGLADEPYMIEWSMDQTFSLETFSDTIADSTFTHSDTLADGTWYFRVRAVDDVGNISLYSEVGEVTVDTTAPSHPSVPTTATPTTNDTPTWSWTASDDGTGVGLATEGYIVEWSLDSNVEDDVLSATATSNTFTHQDELPDGIWYFRVRAVDKVGNVSSNSPIGSVEVDDTPPSIPGKPTTTTPTDDSTPLWSWSASTDNGIGLRNPAAYDVEWSQDENFAPENILSSTSDTNSFTNSTELADGTWYFRVRAVDDLGNTSAYSETGVVLISTDGPSIPGQPTTSTPTTDTTPEWQWDASTSDAELATPAYYLEWSKDEDFLVNVFTDSTSDTTFVHDDALADGVWYFRVRAQDKTGLFSAYAESGLVRVDATAPTAPGLPTTTDPTADNTPQWEWEGSEDAGVGLADEPYMIEWSMDQTFSLETFSDTIADSTFTHSDALADGTWYFRVRAVDDLGNTSAWSGSGEVEVDASAPSVPGTPSTTTPTADNTPAWSWSASSDGDGVGLGNPAYEIQWSQDEDFVVGVIDGSTLAANFTHIDTLADGTWYFRVRAVDDLGNTSAWSGSGEVEVDASAPTVPGTPTTGGQSVNSLTPSWTWDASSDSGVGLGNPAYEVQWSQDSGFDTFSTGNATEDSFSHGTDLSDGTWYIRVRAIDGVGNMSGWSGNGSVYVDMDTPTAPGTPQIDETPTADNTPEWTWDASSDDGFGFGDDPYEVQWSQDDNFVDNVQTGQASAESFTHTISLADGTWHLRVRAVDDAGNVSAWSAHGTVTVDATAPTVPGNLSTQSPTKNSNPTWEWEASEDDGVGPADPLYEMQWSNTSNFSIISGSETGNDPSFTHIDGLNFGVWYFRVRAKDQLGNTSEWAQAQVDIDNVPPVITQINVIAGSSSALITWQTNEIASSKVLYGVGGQTAEETPETDTDPRVTTHSVILQNLSSCTLYQFRVSSIDQLDNEAVSGAGDFITTACSGDAAVTNQAHTAVGAAGGSASLNQANAALNMDIPAGAVPGVTDFQIKQLSPAPALGAIGQPPGRYLIGSHLYDLKAVAEDMTVTTNFNGSLTITITYGATEAAGFDISSLAIFRHDGTAWHQLSNCNVNATARVVSCQTSAFSIFGLFGIRAVAAPAPALPEGAGTVDPDPPELSIPDKQKKPDTPGETEAAHEQRGLSAAFTRIVNTMKRPVWWGTLLLIGVAVATLLLLKHRRRDGRHVPYGIHRDD